MTLSEISNSRIISQKIEGTSISTPKELVGWMGAMQAQDFLMAKWAIGLRLLHSTDAQIVDAYNKGEILRTHLMRPTWHFVSADDIHWLLALTAPRIRPLLKSRDKQLELTEPIYKQANDIIEKSLLNGISLTRDELACEFVNANIATDNNRMSHLMLRAELEGIVCSGPMRGSKLTYGLLADRVSLKKAPTKDESLAELAKRYFTSHCPATMYDFVWWSGLSVTEAKNALEFVKADFVSEKIGTEIYWFTNTFSNPKLENSAVHLLPAFDEFLIAYKDRSATLAKINFKKAVSDNGIFRPVIVENGQVTGLWKRTTKKDKVQIEPTIFGDSNSLLKAGIEKEAKRFEGFLNKKLELIL